MTVARPPDPVVDRYRDRTPRSRALWERALATMPLGVSANLKYFAPYPVQLDRAIGGRAWDVDGNEYVDVTLGAGTHLLGHRHPAVTAAVERQLGRLWQHLVPGGDEIELAERLRARYPQLERIRFATTGSEAMRGTIRVARAVTGRPLVAKMEGHYHGSDDVVLVSSKTGTLAGTATRPAGVADAPGLSRGALDEIVVLPWNDAEAAVQIIEEKAAEIACVLVEPIGFSSAGGVATERAFAAALRAACDRHGIVLVYDEIVTAHRLGPGGAAQWLGVTPDLSAFGKAVGGGFPLSVFGGRADLMEAALGRSALEGVGLVFASGTFTGHAIAAAAGVAVLDVLDAEEPRQHLDQLAERLRHGLDARFRAHGVEAWAIGAASISQVHFTATPPRNRREILGGDQTRLDRFLLGMVAHGVLWPPVHAALSCAAHDETDIDRVLDAADDVLADMRTTEGWP